MSSAQAFLTSVRHLNSFNYYSKLLLSARYTVYSCTTLCACEACLPTAAKSIQVNSDCYEKGDSGSCEQSLFCFCWLCSAVAAFAQVQQLPDSPAGRQMGAWLRRSMAEIARRFLAFLERRTIRRGRRGVDRDMDFRKMTGGFDLRKVEDASTPTKVVALVQERDSDQFLRG